MRIISRYVLTHFFPIFILALIAFMGIYLVVDFFEKVDDLLEKQVPFIDCCLYFLYKTPLILYQGIPMATFLAALIALGILKRNHELIALRAGGVSPAVYAGPIVMGALLLSIVNFSMGETVARPLNQTAQRLWVQKVLHRQVSIAWGKEDVWYHGRHVIYQIGFYDRRRQSLEHVSLFYLSSEFDLIRRIDSKRLRWENQHWVAEEGLILSFDGSDARQDRFDEKPMDLPETPPDFEGIETLPEELSWSNLHRHAGKAMGEGYSAAPYLVELHMRVAFPLTTLVLSLLGITIALRQRLHSGIALGVGTGLLVAFLYFVVLQTGSSLATAGLLPPWVGVWAGNVIFSALMGYLWLSGAER